MPSSRNTAKRSLLRPLLLRRPQTRRRSLGTLISDHVGCAVPHPASDLDKLLAPKPKNRLLIQIFGLNRCFFLTDRLVSFIFYRRYHAFRVAILRVNETFFLLAPAVETFKCYVPASERTVSLVKNRNEKARKCTVEKVKKVKKAKKLKHLSHLQWRVDISYHGCPSRSHGLTAPAPGHGRLPGTRFRQKIIPDR